MIANFTAFFVLSSLLLGLVGMWKKISQKIVWRFATALGTVFLIISSYLCAVSLSGEGARLLGKSFAWSATIGLQYTPFLDGLNGVVLLSVSLGLFSAVLLLKTEVSDAKESISAIAFFQAAVFAALLSEDFLAHIILTTMASLPLAFIVGSDRSLERVIWVRRLLTAESISGVLLLVCALAMFRDKGAAVNDWFRLSIGAFEILPRNILLGMFLVALMLRAQFFPLQTHLRGIYSLQKPTAAILYSIVIVLGLYSLIRFAPFLFSTEWKYFSNGVTVWSVAVAIISVFGLLFAKAEHERLTHYTTIWVAMILLGFAAIKKEAWSGAFLGMLLMPPTMFLLILSTWSLSRRAETLTWQDFFTHPRRAFSWFFSKSAVFALPATGGFYAWVLIWWGATEQRPWMVYAGFFFAMLMVGAYLKKLQTLRAIQIKDENSGIKAVSCELALYELIAFFLSGSLILFVGIFPNYFSSKLTTLAQFLITSFWGVN